MEDLKGVWMIESEAGLMSKFPALQSEVWRL